MCVCVQHSQYHDAMNLSYSKSCGMELRLIGEAVEPHVVLEPDTDRMDFGHTYAGDTSVKKFALKNRCSLAVRYQISLEGRSGEREGFSELDPSPYVIHVL